MPRRSHERGARLGDLLLAKLTGGHIHIAHVSSEWSLNLIAQARAAGINVTCEATPHHFTYTEDELLGYDTNFKMSPPLRTRSDVDAIREGLKSSLIDVIVTDHAPHHHAAKLLECAKQPSSTLGLQTLVPLTLNLVREGVISYEKMAALTSYNAAKILKLKDKGVIAEGYLADIAIIDPGFEYLYDKNLNKSKSQNSPLLGKMLKGAAVITIKSGKTVFEFPNVVA